MLNFRNDALYPIMHVNEHTEPSRIDPNSLPANRAFVVQFRPAMPDGGVSFQGRVEHIASGQVEFFLSEEELRNVFRRLLAQDLR
jgi:hypothetical protein